MPKHSDFEKIYQQFIEKHGEEKGKKLYYAWLNSYDPPLDDTKPMPKHIAKKESYVMPLKVDNFDGRLYLVKALHVGTTGREDLVDEQGLPRLRHYDADELKRAARTLINAPVNLNHGPPLPGANVIWSDYNDEETVVTSLVASKNPKLDKAYDDGDVIGSSVEFGAVDFPQVDGVKPTGIVFTGLAFVTKDFVPGDSKSSVILIKEILAPSSEKAGESHAEEKEVEPLSEKGTPQANETKKDLLPSHQEDIEQPKKEILPPMDMNLLKEAFVPTFNAFLESIAKNAPTLTIYDRNFWAQVLAFMNVAFDELKAESEKTIALLQPINKDDARDAANPRPWEKEEILIPTMLLEYLRGKKIESVEKPETKQTPPSQPTPAATPVIPVATPQPAPTPPAQAAPAPTLSPQPDTKSSTPAQPTPEQQKTAESTSPAGAQGVGIVEQHPVKAEPSRKTDEILALFPSPEQLAPKMGRPAVSRMLEDLKVKIKKKLGE
jgi:hypothetical protein